MKHLATICLCMAASTVGALAQPPGGRPASTAIDTNVVNTPDVNIVNVPDVIVTNDSSAPVPVRAVVRRIPVTCIVDSFDAADSKDATCVSPNGIATPVPAGYFLLVTDVIATSQLPNGSVGQGIVRVSNRLDQVEFGAGVAVILKPGETQSLHYRSPDQVIPQGHTPTASVATSFGDVFPVEVRFTGYLVAEGDLGYE